MSPHTDRPLADEPSRGDATGSARLASLRWMPRHGWALALAVGAIIAVLPLTGGINQLWRGDLEVVAIYGLLIAGFNLSYGYGGQLALGQVAVFAGGAYTAGILASHGVNELALGLVIAIVLSAVLGLITGLPGLRLGEWPLAVITLFLVQLIEPLTHIFDKETGGTNGITGILSPKLFGIALSDDAFFALVVGLTTLTLLFYRNLVVSRYGHSMLELKHGVTLARSLGFSPTRLRLRNYVLGSLPAGVAGVLYAYYATYIDPVSFNFDLIVVIVAGAVIGGARSIWAAPIAAGILVIIPERISAFQDYSTIGYGVFMVASGIFLAAGLAGLGSTAVQRAFGRGALADTAPTIAEGGGDDGLGTAQLDGSRLATRGITKRFDGVQALGDVDFTAEPGSITAIIGANGAGKTTLLNVISGLIPPDAGEVRLGDEAITHLAPDRIARAGVARTFQTPQVPESLTVLDAAAGSVVSESWVSPASVGLRLPRYLSATREDRRRAMAALRFVGLDGQAGELAESEPLGRRRMLEVARCLAAQPAAILLDEPAAGLDPDAIANLGSVLRRMRDAGATVVLIEHNMRFVMDIADTVTVLELGRVIASGPPETVRADKRVIASYLGRRQLTHTTLDASSEPIHANDD